MSFQADLSCHCFLREDCLLDYCHAEALNSCLSAGVLPLGAEASSGSHAGNGASLSRFSLSNAGSNVNLACSSAANLSFLE